MPRRAVQESAEDRALTLDVRPCPPVHGLVSRVQTDAMQSGEVGHVATSGSVCTQFANKRGCQSGTPVVFTPSNFWVEVHVVVGAARSRFRMQTRAVPIPSRQSLRVNPRTVSVASGATLGMQARAVLIPSSRSHLRNHVCRIGSGGSKPEMPYARVLDAVNSVNADRVVSHASSHIARVAYDLTSCRPLPCRKSPRKHVSISMLPEASNPAVAISLYGACPQPAVIAVINPCPEALFNAVQRMLATVQAVTTSTTEETDIGLPTREDDAAAREARRGCIIRLHRVSPSLGVTPRSVRADAGFSRVNYTTSLEGRAA